MIIVDFQHLSYRNLHTCIYSTKPQQIEGKYITEDYIGMYYFQMLTSLNKIYREFSDFGEIVIALDGFKNWRKQLLQNFYKADRKRGRDESPIKFDEFFKHQNELIDFLKGFTKVIQVEEAEADDIGFVLANYTNEQTLLITSDKDWKQHLIDNLNVHLFDPLKNEFIQNSKEIQEDLKLYRLKHILLGDKVDGIPNVMYETELHPDFKKFLESQGIYIETPSEFLEKVGDIEYEGEKFKTPRFGEKTAEKLIQNPTDFIRKKVKDKKKFYQNFRMNRQLVDLRKIPRDVKEKIIDTYNNTKIIKPNKEFIEKYNLQKCLRYTINKPLEYLNDYSDFNDLKKLF